MIRSQVLFLCLKFKTLDNNQFPLSTASFFCPQEISIFTTVKGTKLPTHFKNDDAMETLVKKMVVVPPPKKYEAKKKVRPNLNVGKHTPKVQKTNAYSQSQYDELITIKKQRQATEKDQSKLFLSIGLMLSLLFVITAMEWKFSDQADALSLDGVEMRSFEEILDIPNTTQPPPPPPESTQAPIIKAVADEVVLEEVKMNLDVEMTEATVVEQVVYDDVVFEEIKEEVVEEVFTIVEVKPEPVGGLSAFYSYVAENLRYPEQAKRNNISGRVYLRFVVEKDGSITDVVILKGIGGGCDEEAKKVIQNAPKWIPGRQRGNPVRVYMSVPITFTLIE